MPYIVIKKIANIVHRMKALNHIIITCVLLILLIAAGCKKDIITTNSDAKLNFSVDSILFDTVFTSIGSTTKTFKLYNNNKQKVNISKAYLVGGAGSQFRINIDGVSGPEVSNIEVLSGDSLFVFVQVTVNPTGSNNPVLINESLVFETNNNSQQIALTAVGQDVHLHVPDIFPTNGTPAYSKINTSTAWTNDKPHLIFGYAVVDSDSILTMNPGTKVYMNTGAVLWVFKNGSLVINGNKDNEVTFEGARLEEKYDDVAGQWGKIWLFAGSKNNVINWANIKNGGIGVQVDSLGNPGQPTLTISNTIINNMSAAAIFAKEGHIKAYNNVFSNCGQYLVALSSGGNYNFEHCTFYNGWTSSTRATPSLYLNNYFITGTTYYARDLDSAYFGNCIIDGNLEEEISLDQVTNQGIFSFKFENCLLKTKYDVASDTTYFKNNLKNVSPGFVDADGYNYRLSNVSPAIDKGKSSLYTKDLNNEVRPNPSTSIADVGAYEFY